MSSKFILFVFLVLVAVIAYAMFTAVDVFAHAYHNGYELRHDACNTYHALLGGQDEHVADFCGRSESITVFATPTRKVKHTDLSPTATPPMSLVTVPPPTIEVTATPPVIVPPTVEACQDDEDDGGPGEDDSIDDLESEDCEDEDDNQ